MSSSLGGADGVISALVSRKLAIDPAQRTASNGSTFVTASLRVSAGPEAVFIGVVAFGETAAAKLQHMRRGGSIAAVGALEINVWAIRDGVERRDWRLTASEILTVYGATKKRRQVEEVAA